jgi:hypothetical protein
MSGLLRIKACSYCAVPDNSLIVHKIRTKIMSIVSKRFLFVPLEYADE